MKKIISQLSSPHLLAGILAAGSLSFTTVSQAADLVIGEPNWPSAQVTANVIKVVLEDNLGLEVEVQSGNNAVIFEAMDKGSMSVHPEVWLPNQQNFHDKYVKERGSVVNSKNSMPSTQGMCATKDTVAMTGIKKLSDLADPEMAKNFDTDGDGKGEMWIGVAGWASTNIEKIRGKSYGYDVNMTYKEIDEPLALAEVDNAVKSKKPIVFFCYTPHHMFALYDLVMLEEDAHDPSQWEVYQPTDDPNWLEKSKALTAYSEVQLSIHYAKALETKQPEASRVLSKIKLTTDMVAAMTYAVVVDKKSPAEYAKKWVSENSDIVDGWLN